MAEKALLFETAISQAMDRYRTATIYALADPQTNQIRYVGATTRACSRRFMEHWTRSLRSKTHVERWIAHLRRMGMRPQFLVLEREVEDWGARERYWIAKLQNQGIDLTNGTIGGEGTLGHIKSALTRARLSAALTGKKLSPERVERMRQRRATPETCQKISAAQKGKKARPESCAKRSESMKRLWASGYRHSPEAVARMSAARRGATLSVETRQKISESKKGKPRKAHSREVIEKIAEKHRGMKRSPETRAKMSAAKAGVSKNEAFKQHLREITDPEVMRQRGLLSARKRWKTNVQ